MNGNRASGKIRRVEERLAYSDPKNSWVQLYFDRVHFPDGSQGYYNRIIEGQGFPSVAVIPVRDGFVGMIHQYRYPIGLPVWEIPRGFGESPNPREGAARELLEETGIEVGEEDLLDLGIVHPNSGLLSTEVHVFAVEVSHNHQRTVSNKEKSPQEAFEWIAVDEVVRRASEGELTDVFTICALFRAKQRNLI